MPEETTSAVTTTTAIDLPNLVNQADSDAMLLILLGTAILLILLLLIIKDWFARRRRPCEYCDAGRKILCRRLEEKDESIQFDSEEFYAVYCPICGQAIPKKEE